MVKWTITLFEEELHGERLIMILKDVKIVNQYYVPPSFWATSLTLNLNGPINFKNGLSQPMLKKFLHES
jgi:hypothetical protein